MIVCLDTSVVVKTLVAEAGSAAVTTAIDAHRERGDRLFSSSIVITELRRAASRIGVDDRVTTAALQRLALVRVTDQILEQAGELSGASLRSLDAIHIASALSIGADVLLTADHRQAIAARDAGLVVVDEFA